MARERSVLVELAVVNALASQLFDSELERMGVRTAHVGLLWILADVGPATPRQLELATGLPPSTLRERLGALQSAGLVTRRPNAADGRSYYVQVAKEGTALLRRAERAVRRVEDDLAARLGHSVEELRPLLERLRAAQQEALAERGGLQAESAATSVLFR